MERRIADDRRHRVVDDGRGHRRARPLKRHERGQLAGSGAGADASSAPAMSSMSSPSLLMRAS